jgi:hypothetical protein
MTLCLMLKEFGAQLWCAAQITSCLFGVDPLEFDIPATINFTGLPWELP